MTSRDLPDLARVIRFRPREDYLGLPIPSARDDEITRHIERLVDEAAMEASAKRVRTLFETNLSPYAQRMAALAVRRRDPAPIRNGMRAAALESATADPRDAVIVYPLLWRSLVKLGFDPAREFADLATRLGAYGESLRAFAARPPAARTVEAMRSAETGEGPDFRHEARWQ